MWPYRTDRPPDSYLPHYFHLTLTMDYAQFRARYGHKTFTGAMQLGYPTPQAESFTNTGTTINYEDTLTPTQSPQLADHDLANGPFIIQSDIINVTKIDELTVSPDDLMGESPEELDEIVSVSTAFHPTAHPHLPPADTVLSSSDGVLFYVHSNTILSTCESAFGAFLGSPLGHPKFRDTFVPVPSISAELNVILHLLYGISPSPYSPSFEVLVSALFRMSSYSIMPSKHILSGTPLFDLLLSHAPLRPLDVYALAAHHDIHSLAVMASPHLLPYPLQNITDSQADRMGALYLKKLMNLHINRFNALKGMLLRPPHPHAPTRECDFSAQKKLTRAWSLASAHLVWDARPDMSVHSIHATLDPLLIQLECKDCEYALRVRIKDLVVRWTAVRFYSGCHLYSFWRHTDDFSFRVLFLIQILLLRWSSALVPFANQFLS